MDLSQIIPHIEALIFASDKPLTTHDIVELINNAFAFMEERISLEQVEAAVEGIQEKYNAEFYPFEVRESGGGWQFLTKKEFHQTVGQLNGDKFLKRLSNAALETLAIIAYKQPITKGEVESIRGVNSDYSIQKLLEKELIVISGRNENLPGKPLVYATSKAFMDYFGINNTNDSPKIKEVLAEQLIEATVVNSAMNAHEDQVYKDANTPETPKAQRELFAEGEDSQTALEKEKTSNGDVAPISSAVNENVIQVPTGDDNPEEVQNDLAASEMLLVATDSAASSTTPEPIIETAFEAIGKGGAENNGIETDKPEDNTPSETKSVDTHTSSTDSKQQEQDNEQ